MPCALRQHKVSDRSGGSQPGRNGRLADGKITDIQILTGA
jgi:hypothetical protein